MVDRPDRPSDRSYSLEPEEELVPPALPGLVDVVDVGEDVLDLLTADLLAQAIDSVHRYGSFHLAISGSESLEPLCRRLMFDPDLRRLPWDRTHLWIADDRCVPRNDPLSCFWRLRDTLIMPAGIPLANVHPIPSTDESADELVEKALVRDLDGRSHGGGRLDCIILDTGGDGRVGGMFPGDDAVLEKTRRVRFAHCDDDPCPQWVSLTFPTILAARMIQVLACGSETGKMLRQLETRSQDVRNLPASRLVESEGLLKWYLDREAAGDQE